MTNTKVSIVQKAKYGLLLIPILWLLFSILVVINDASADYGYAKTQYVPPAPSLLQVFSVGILGLVAVYAGIRILQQVKKHDVVSAELKSTMAFSLGLTIMSTSQYFHLWRFLFYVGVAIFDIAVIIMLITLFQGKAFGLLKLYHKDVQIQKNSS